MIVRHTLNLLTITLVVCTPAYAMGEKVEKTEPIICKVPDQLEETNIIQWAAAARMYKAVYEREAVKKGDCSCPYNRTWNEFYAEFFPERKPKDVPPQEIADRIIPVSKLNEQEYGKSTIYLPFFNASCREE